MKKSILTSLAVAVVMTASAQSVQKDEAPKPPPPPKPPVARVKDVPPPPPAPEPPDAPPPPPALANSGAQLQDPDAFMKKNPSVKNVQWKKDEIIIGLKSGKEERYDLTDAASKKAAETKYGVLPRIPPPPPLPPKPPKKGRTLS